MATTENKIQITNIKNQAKSQTQFEKKRKSQINQKQEIKKNIARVLFVASSRSERLALL